MSVGYKYVSPPSFYHAAEYRRKRVFFDKTTETSAHILIPYERMHLVRPTRRMIGGDVTFYLKFFVIMTHSFRKGRFSIDIRS